MNLKNITIAILGLTFLPLFAHAQSVATTTVSTSTQSITQVYTLCTQNAIRKRDTALVTARSAYNTDMNSALEARTVTETSAVALADETEQADALSTAAVAYSASVKQAQDTLKAARQTTLLTYDEEIKKCKADKQFTQANASGYNKKMTGDTTELRKVSYQSEKQADTLEIKGTFKAIQEEYKKKINDLKSFFKSNKTEIEDKAE